MTHIFLSYRRDDSEAAAGHIRLVLEEAGHKVFMDRTAIQAAERWPDQIRSALHDADIVLAIIGNHWLTSILPDGRRRIDSEEDWVRLELRTALQSGKKIIPVLVKGASLPPPESLPEDIRDLSNRQGVRLTREYWDIDLQHMLKNISSEISPTESKYLLGAEPEQLDNVSFTAIYPKETPVETWHSLLVYAHLESALEAIRKDAQRFKEGLEPLKESTSPASAPLRRGSEIIIVPRCKGVTFNPRRVKLTWIEDFHRADFRFRAKKSLARDAGKGSITIFVGPLIVGTVKFAVLFNDKEETSLSQEEVCSPMYHMDKIFISYSHLDTDMALAFKKVHEATGYDVLIDVDDLRSGQEWNAELMRMIDRADIFQLFWSENSRKSKYCKQEWKYALKRAAEGFVRPVYWQKPLPKPPKELRKLHFQYVKL